jgi:hypothetical protein
VEHRRTHVSVAWLRFAVEPSVSSARELSTRTPVTFADFLLTTMAAVPSAIGHRANDTVFEFDRGTSILEGREECGMPSPGRSRHCAEGGV